MGSIDIIKPLSTVPSSTFNKSQQHQVNNSWEPRELNPGLLGERQVCYLCPMQPPPILYPIFGHVAEHEVLVLVEAEVEVVVVEEGDDARRPAVLEPRRVGGDVSFPLRPVAKIECS